MRKKKRKRGYDKGFVDWLLQPPPQNMVKWYDSYGNSEKVTVEEYMKRKASRDAKR